MNRWAEKGVLSRAETSNTPSVNVGLNQLLEADPTLKAVMELPDGWEAERDSPSEPWRPLRIVE
jgi:hypothetical protein